MYNIHNQVPWKDPAKADDPPCHWVVQIQTYTHMSLDYDDPGILSTPEFYSSIYDSVHKFLFIKDPFLNFTNIANHGRSVMA